MSNYATLLEDYFEEEKYQNDTFTSVASCLESLTNLVNEDVDFTMTISLQEAADGEIKDKNNKITAAVKTGINKLIAKIQQFIEKITEAVKRFVAKAKVTISQKGNNAMKKLLADNSLIIGKDIKLTQIIGRDKAVGQIFAKASGASKNLAEQSGKVLAMIEAGDTTEVVRYNFTSITKTVEALSKDIATSELSENVPVKAESRKTVAEMYKVYVGCYLDIINANLQKIQGDCDTTKKNAKAMQAKLKAVATKEAPVSADAIAKANSYATDAMKLASYTVNFAMSILTIATKNSAKIALAATDAQGKKAAAAVKAAPGQAKEAGKKAVDSAKDAGKKAADKVKNIGKKEETAEEEA